MNRLLFGGIAAYVAAAAGVLGASSSFELTVAAGRHERNNVPVRVPIPTAVELRNRTEDEAGRLPLLPPYVFRASQPGFVELHIVHCSLLIAHCPSLTCWSEPSEKMNNEQCAIP